MASVVRVLVLNCGSSSLKFQVVEIDDRGRAAPRQQRQPSGQVERIGGAAVCSVTDAHGQTHRESRPISDHEEAADYVLHRSGLRTAPPLDAVGHRVVHGADRFVATTRIDARVLAELEALADLAPLHNPACIAGIRAAQRVCGADVPMAAVFDTAFHHTLPDYAATYALPADLARRHGIRRYGFHGIAHASAAARYTQLSGRPLETVNLITLHLGNGCSATAIHHGRSVDTSMGFTPLEGLIMGTRCGDLDPAVIGHLARREAVSVETVEGWLNQQSGLLGISGRSNDMRTLLAAMDQDEAARLAVEAFCYRAAKYVGAYLAVLNGADALIFSGGIGQHCPPVRARIAERLRWCGLRLDADRNALTGGGEGLISVPNGLQAYVIAADEELLIAHETLRCIH